MADDKIERYEKIGDTLKDLANSIENPVQAVIDKFDSLGGKAKIVAGAFSFLTDVITESITASKELYTNLNKIVGINGNVGKLAEAITSAATGSVTRKQISEFLSATGTLFKDATVMQDQLGYVNNLIGLYGDVNTAVQKFQNSLFLSADAQKEFSEYAQRANEIIQQSPAARLEATSNALKEMVVTIGGDLLYVLQPLLSLVGAIADTLRALNNESKGQGLSEAQVYEKLQALAEEYGMTLEELNDIEKGLFTSSLDEVMSVGSGIVDESGVFGVSTDALEETADQTTILTEDFTELHNILVSIWEIFTTLFEAIGPSLLSLTSDVLGVVSGFIDWLDKAGLLEPLMGSLLGIMLAIAAIKFSSWISSVVSALTTLTASATTATAAQTGLAVSGMAAAASTSYGIAVPIILAALGIGIAGLASYGLSVSGSSGSSSVGTNDYDGVDKSVSDNSNVEVVLDGNKVNSALSRAKRTSGEEVD